MEPVECLEESATPAQPRNDDSKTILQPFRSDGQDIFWPDIEEALRKVIQDETSVVNALAAVRAGEMTAFGVWIPTEDPDMPRRVGAVIVVRVVHDGYSGGSAMWLYAIHGHGMTMKQWKDADEQLTLIAKAHGISSLISITAVPQMVDLAKATGWDTTRVFCEKRLF